MLIKKTGKIKFMFSLKRKAQAPKDSDRFLVDANHTAADRPAALIKAGCVWDL